VIVAARVFGLGAWNLGDARLKAGATLDLIAALTRIFPTICGFRGWTFKPDRLKPILLHPCIGHGLSAIVTSSGGDFMAAKNKLKDAAVRIGGAMGKADGVAHKAVREAAEAADIAKEELAELSKQVKQLKKQLKKSTKRLKSAFK
jgi:hypothetical protein